MREVQMPDEWTDAAGWERYYAGLYPQGDYRENSSHLGSVSLENLHRISASYVESQGAPAVAWVPGCGISGLPKAMAAMGMIVHATDISPTAIAFQQSADNEYATLAADLRREGGALICQVHDFRTPYLDGAFDLVLNVKAMQGFDFETMKQIAAVHYRALKSTGGQAVFDTMNVQGALRNMLEESIVSAGFFLPFYALDRWYREQLDATGIPYVMILGRPMPPYREEFDTHPELRQQEQSRLREVAAEYDKRREAELPVEQQLANAATHFAHVIYSTG